MSTEELPGGESSLSVGGVDYVTDSKEITSEQHKNNLIILRRIGAGLGNVAVRDEDEVAGEIRDIFNEESRRYWDRCSATEECDREYDGFVDPDGYNNPASYGYDRR